MHSRGFTLVELMVALAVLAMLLAIGLPSFAGLIDQQRMDSRVDRLLRSIHFARSEAIRQNRFINMAPLQDGAWHDGWVVFIDDNHNGRPDPGEALLREERLGNTGSLIHSSNSIASYLRYNHQGESELLNGGFQSGTFSFCPQHSDAMGRQVIINRVGRARVQRAQVSGCP